MSQNHTSAVKKPVRQGKFVSVETLATQKQQGMSSCSGSCASGTCMGF